MECAWKIFEHVETLSVILSTESFLPFWIVNMFPLKSKVESYL
jgi:hypothetical protein